jgi:hypothetical protein
MGTLFFGIVNLLVENSGAISGIDLRKSKNK